MSANKPIRLKRNGNLNTNWNEFKHSFDNYLIASRVHENDNEQAGAEFLAKIGQYGVEIASELKLLNARKDNIDSSLTLQNVYEQFDKYCQSNSSLNLHRYHFFNSKQGSEKFERFLSSLTAISEICKFGDLKKNLIMIQIISGISDTELQDDLYSIVDDLDLEETIQKCKAWKSKKSQNGTSNAKKSSLTEAKSKRDKNNNDYKSPSRKRTFTEKSETDLEKSIPEGSPSTSKIPRKMTSNEETVGRNDKTKNVEKADKTNYASEATWKLTRITSRNESDSFSIKSISKHAKNNYDNIGPSRSRGLEKPIPKSIPSTSKVPQTDTETRRSEETKKGTNDNKTNSASEATGKLFRNKNESEWEEGEIVETAPIRKGSRCSRCGNIHGSYCRHFYSICQLCGIRGHIAVACAFFHNKL